MSYALADLELYMAERRLALQTAALDARERRDELLVEAERPLENAISKQQAQRSWWRYY